MEYNFVLLLVQIFLFINSIEGVPTNNTNQGAYGPFKVSYFVLKNCEKVMKPRGEVTLISILKTNKEGHKEVESSLQIAKDIGPLMGKTRIYKWTDGKYVKTLTMSQANVCQYAFPLKLLPFTFEVDSKCVAKIATYNTTLDVDNLARGLLGKKFFYGRFKIIFEWFTKKLTAICCECETELSQN